MAGDCGARLYCGASLAGLRRARATISIIWASRRMSAFRRLAATKLSHAKYLTHGRLWRPPGAPPTTMRLHDYSYEEHDPTQFCLTPLVPQSAGKQTMARWCSWLSTTRPQANERSVSLHEAGEGFAQSDALHAVVESTMKPRSVIVVRAKH